MRRLQCACGWAGAEVVHGHRCRGGGRNGVSEPGLSIVGDITPGFPARTGYGTAAYGNTEPSGPLPRWLLVRPDGRVTVYAGKVEYGQNIRTGFAVEVADELRVPLSAVNVVLGDTGQTPWDMGTFGSQSTARVGVQLRRAAATAREQLLALAADRLDLPASELECRDGSVVSRSDPSHSVDYGELVSGRALECALDPDAALTPAADFTVMGRPSERVDALARVTGAAVYSQDVRVPGMLFAVVVRPPSYGARLRAVESRAAETLPGVVRIARDG